MHYYILEVGNYPKKYAETGKVSYLPLTRGVITSNNDRDHHNEIDCHFSQWLS